MVDVFLSYSKADRALVERLDADLNAAGFTTWWDKGLTTGEDFGPTIDRHLSEARAVISLWTANSIKSQWVRAEATKANAVGKLIPVRARDIEYENIPPPFNILDTGEITETGRIIEALKVLLEKPAIAPSHSFLLKAKTRQEILAWVGILGAVLTVSANLRGLINVAKWANWLLENWMEVITWFWKTVLFFLPQLTIDDASLLAILVFLFMNIAACLVNKKPHNSIWASIGSLTIGAGIMGSIYLSAVAEMMVSTPGITGTVFDWLWVSFIAPMFDIDTRFDVYPEHAMPIIVATSLAVLAVGLLGVLLGIWLVSRWRSVFIDSHLLLRRLSRIVIGVMIVALLSWGYNQLESFGFLPLA